MCMNSVKIVAYRPILLVARDACIQKDNHESHSINLRTVMTFLALCNIIKLSKIL